MRWKLFANLAETAGQREIELEFAAEADLEDALAALIDAHPELEPELLDEDGDLHDHVRILQDGTDPFSEKEGLETTVDADDELAVFPPVSGG